MTPTLDSLQIQLEARPRRGVGAPALHALEGTIQRVNYEERVLAVVADGRAWSFTLSKDCQLWFQGKLAPLRCFHPLDHIRLYYESQGSRLVAQALYVWEFFP